MKKSILFIGSLFLALSVVSCDIFHTNPVIEDVCKLRETLNTCIKHSSNKEVMDACSETYNQSIAADINTKYNIEYAEETLFADEDYKTGKFKTSINPRTPEPGLPLSTDETNLDTKKDSTPEPSKTSYDLKFESVIKLPHSCEVFMANALSNTAQQFGSMFNNGNVASQKRETSIKINFSDNRRCIRDLNKEKSILQGCRSKIKL